MTTTPQNYRLVQDYNTPLAGTPRYDGLEYDYEIPDTMVVASPGGASSTHHHWTKGFYGYGGMTNDIYGYSNPRYPYGDYGNMYVQGYNSSEKYYGDPAQDKPYWRNSQYQDPGPAPNMPRGPQGYFNVPGQWNLNDASYVETLREPEFRDRYPPVPLDEIHNPPLLSQVKGEKYPMPITHASHANTVNAYEAPARHDPDPNNLEYFTNELDGSFEMIEPDDVITVGMPRKHKHEKSTRSPSSPPSYTPISNSSHHKKVHMRINSPVLLFIAFLVLYITLDLWSFGGTKFIIDKIHHGKSPSWQRFFVYALVGGVVFVILLRFLKEPLSAFTTE